MPNTENFSKKKWNANRGADFGALTQSNRSRTHSDIVSNDATRRGKLAQKIFIFKSNVNVNVMQNKNNNNSNTVNGFRK